MEALKRYFVKAGTDKYLGWCGYCDSGEVGGLDQGSVLHQVNLISPSDEHVGVAYDCSSCIVYRVVIYTMLIDAFL